MTATAQDIHITRVLDAPRERIWRAWTDPDEIARWWGKRGWSTPPESVTLDVRPGGVFRLNSINDDDGREMPHEATYREVVEPERLVWNDGERIAVVSLRDLGDGRTEMTFRATMRASDELRARAEGGLRSAFDRLAELLDQPDDKGASG
jgi:uncharacterized protein YndB with AHSA1/START domain